MLPERVEDIFQDVDAHLGEELVIGEGIGLIAVRTFQVTPNDGRRKLTFSHGDRQTERENGIDEAMRVPDTDETFAAKSIYLIRVVRNHVHVFHQFDLRNSTTQLGMKFAKFANVKITLALFFIQEVGGWAYYSHANKFLIEGYEPSPGVFLLIEDYRIVLVSFASAAVVP